MALPFIFFNLHPKISQNFQSLQASIRRPRRVFFCPRDLGAKQTWRLDTIARLLSEKVLTVSHNNIHRPSAPEKEVNQKENTLGKIAKKATDDAADFKVYVYSDLGEVLFHYVIFRDKENRDLSSTIYRVSSVELGSPCLYNRGERSFGTRKRCTFHSTLMTFFLGECAGNSQR